MNLPTSGTAQVPIDERRAAACLRACEGIPTELLEGGIILKLIAACVHLADTPRIREVLEELVVARLRREERRVNSLKQSRLVSRASLHRIYPSE